MNSISQKYVSMLQKLVNDCIKDRFSFKPMVIPTNGVFNYINISSGLDETINNIARRFLISYFATLDENFKNSPNRSNRYHIKNVYKRSILTMFGEITYSKTTYKSTLNGSSYCPVDRLLGLKPHDYYDPFIKALVVKYAANNSYAKTAEYINNLIANRFKLNNNSKYLMTRQTVHNIVKQADMELTESINEKEIDTLYVMADEHFVGSQDKENDYMIKHVVVFEDIKTVERKKQNITARRNNKKTLLPRRKLVNKHVISVVDSSIHTKTLDYIFNNYNINKIKNIIVMGDGASWINSLKKELKFDANVTVTFGLDKYHFKQALHRIFLNGDIEKIAENYIINNNKKDFIELTNQMIITSPHREKRIIQNRDYILNHIKSIIYLYDKKLSCPMESQISHNIASRFSSRPCGFSQANMKQLIKLKTMDVNNQNIILTYLNNLNHNNHLIINTYDKTPNTTRYDLKPIEQKIINDIGQIKTNIPFI